MPNYTRAFQPGGTFFLTLVTERRAPIFAEESSRAILHGALEQCRKYHDFVIDAIVLLPDHLHLIMTLPERDADFSIRVNNLKANFTRRYLEAGGAEQEPSSSRRQHRSRGVWQRRFWEHTIRDPTDLRHHLDYVHFNPVKHGYVRCPHDWPHSSFRRFVAENCYDLNWCCQCDSRTTTPDDFEEIAESAGE
jgi:putative transposase